jgi:hypothetical protein
LICGVKGKKDFWKCKKIAKQKRFYTSAQEYSPPFPIAVYLEVEYSKFMRKIDTKQNVKY